jgi:hypothetical protein
LLPVSCRRISPRAVANDNDTAASLTFTNCTFRDNVYDTWRCMYARGWICYFSGPAGAAGVTTASDVTFKGSTVFKRNDWGALFVASPRAVSFEGDVIVADNTKQLDTSNHQGSAPTGLAPAGGAGLHASDGALLLFSGAAVFR